MEEITYKKAGVDIDEGDRFVSLISPLVKKTFRPEVMTDIGSFGGLFKLDMTKYKEPVLVSGTDGVGTKLKVAFLTDKHDTVGIDLVAMCVNDILTLGAEPLFFLDYFATGKLDADRHSEVVKGIAEGCKQSGCALIGGETAEMPGFYSADEYDMAGFAVGVVDKNEVINGSTIAEGDSLIGIASSGIHSNGYSLVRKVLFEAAGLTVESRVPELGKSLGEELITPTRIYVKGVQALKGKVDIRGMAHITGGGIPGNLPRILSDGLTAVIRDGSWEVPAIFSLIQKLGNVPADDLKRTFNMGIGYIIVINPRDTDSALSILAENGYEARCIGRIEKGEARIRYE
ncbi:MAG: phosphoribosylformylglycinamidine cyclo-ligase [Thermodesulfovibrionales bacterium]|jgi:phosphoribosylformylglycinamidine cyclo-ligase